MAEPITVGIEGVLRFELVTHPDARGWFAEDYRRGWLPAGSEMVQGNVSFSRANVLRGLHFHRKQADWWTFLQGAAVVGLYDLRSGSPTEGVGLALHFDVEDGLQSLYIPAGVAHGFYAERDVLLHYLVDATYSGADELGLAWDDPALRIAWPSAEPVLSDRDASNPTLAEVVGQAPRFEA